MCPPIDRDMPSIGVFLDPDEPATYELIRPDGQSPFVLVCDHASNRFPARLNNLGLRPEHAHSHIAWDPGAARLAHLLSEELDATLVLSAYSRLVIDCNRPPGHHESIVRESDGIVIPGNAAVTKIESARRRQLLFDPYHEAVAGVLDGRSWASGGLLSIHSFTRCLNGCDRPWSIGVCYHDEKAWARRMIEALRARTDDPVGDNEPYAVEVDCDYTVPAQGEKRDIPSLMLEVRQDKLESDHDQEKWCNIIAASCRASR